MPANADERQLAGQRQLVDLGQLLRNIRASIVLSRQDLDLDLEVKPDVVTEGNPEHLERLFRNIIENALRFARARVVLRSASGTTTVQVEVLDDGPGIPAAERERVFDRFVRLDTSRERRTGTAGLGLAIARDIAVAHNGQITVGDTNGGGARIVITLPRATANRHD
jgi:signal transduction histidine kinase